MCNNKFAIFCPFFLTKTSSISPLVITSRKVFLLDAIIQHMLISSCVT